MVEYLANPMIGNYAWNKLYRRDLFEDIRFPKGHKIEDLAIMYKIFEKCECVAFEASELYYYYQREDSVTHTIDVDLLRDWTDFLCERFDFVKEKYPGLLQADIATTRELWLIRTEICLQEKDEELEVYAPIKEKVKALSEKMDPNVWKYLGWKMRIKQVLYKISPELYIRIIIIVRKIRKTLSCKREKL